MEAMEMRVFSVFLLLCFGGFREALTQQALTQSLKSNVTQFLGSNIVIVCSSDSMSSTTNQPSWYKYDPQKELIYDSTTQEAIDATKYSVGNGNNTLTVMNVQLTDALTYCCNVGGLRDYCANVVLIDSVTPSVNPSNGVKVGDAVNLTCFLSYNAPAMDDNAPFPLSNDQNPNLMMLIGQTDVTGDTTGEQVVGTGTLPHSKIISFNKTVQQGDAGQNLTCTVSSASPKVNNQTSTPINVNVATKHAWINYPSNYTRNSDVVYPLDSVFTCGGDGYPIPTCEWLDGTNNKSVENKRMKGNVTWKASQQGTYDRVCAATYDPTGNTTYNFTRIYVGSGPSANASKAADNKVGLGVGLGIGLGVPILIGLIILVVILARRKKKASGPYPVKQPEKTSKSPATGKSPNGKNNDPTAGPRNNVNPNPNPTYTTPVMPEQTGNAGPKNVRDSPGYGDLGVRHIGGSGSNPHLNESFDSKADASFDSSRNHSAGGNIAFKPGRAGQSPSAPNTSV